MDRCMVTSCASPLEACSKKKTWTEQSHNASKFPEHCNISSHAWLLWKTATALHFANSCGSAIQEKEHRDRFCAFIPPGVSRPVLHNHVATLQMQRLTVVQFQPNLSVEDNRVVDSVRLVHPGIFFFEMIG